jgi:hypothetical protein
MPKSENPTSLRRQESSRANGAKSRGPVTPEGKARSSRNAYKHGCLAKITTITIEEEDNLLDLQAQYESSFAPRNQPEYDVVTQIAWATFRLQHACAEEASLIGLQMDLDKEEVDEAWDDLADDSRRALAIVACLKESNALSLVQRYIRSLSTQIERSIKLLLLMQKQPLPAPPEADVRNEPIPIDQHRPELPNEPKSSTVNPDEPDHEPDQVNEQKEPSPINEHRRKPVQDPPA